MSAKLNWYELTAKKRFEFNTAGNHVIEVKREAIPVIFVPGVMGTRLARNGTIVWDPAGEHDEGASMDFFFSGAKGRKRMIVGPGAHNPNYLTVHDAAPDQMPGNNAEDRQRQFDRGWGGLRPESYYEFMMELDTFLRSGTLHTEYERYFDFPLYGAGYNWTADTDLTGAAIAQRVTAIIAEHNNNETICEKVIFVTHSMGGLASRSAMFLHGVGEQTLGAIHGVHPVTGGPAGYKRVRKGFSGAWKERVFLGRKAEHVTPIFANSPGPLQLMPTKMHKNNAEEADWFKVRSGGRTVFSLPQNGDPFAEIYRQRRTWWRLVDETLVDPGGGGQSRGNPGWGYYTTNLDKAERFHEALGMVKHDRTYQIYGKGTTFPTFDGIVWDVEIDYTWPRSNAPLTSEMQTELAGDPDGQAATSGSSWIQGVDCTFDLRGKQINAYLIDPTGSGDGTVPESSGKALLDTEGSRGIENVGHEPAYKSSAVSDAAQNAISRLIKDYFDARLAEGQSAQDSPSTQGPAGSPLDLRKKSQPELSAAKPAKLPTPVVGPDRRGPGKPRSPKRR